ncbi:MAG: hypothetical protein QOK41_800 [Sphingomonadales bacterium]|nr:hypothetical protein [Sphingomonadales bacterium]
MSPRLAAAMASVLLAAGGVLLAAGSAALAHHSFAVFDIEHPLELQGTVRQFKFSSPHTFIILEVEGDDGTTTIWNLEGASQNIMVRNGWSSQILKSGDQIKLTIDPLRSGAPGGAWTGQKTTFSSGRPVVCCVFDAF